MKDRFAQYHPLVNFLYFTLVLVFSMVLRHPLAQGVSLLCAFCLVMGTAASAFSHEGVTILLYLPTGNPLTLESILYGVSAGVLLVTVMVWFMNSSRVITSDKFIYLFGRVIPALSLVLSMTLRFIPKFKSQLAAVVEAQRSIGRDISQGSLLRRMKLAVSVLSIMITWALENAMDTADSMKGRGYGLPGRTAFSIYRLDDRDKSALAFLLLCAFCLVMGTAASAFSFRYYPGIRAGARTPLALSFQLVYAALCAMPILLNAFEERKWKSIHSKM